MCWKATPLLSDASACVVNQDPTHRLRGDREEVNAILVRHGLAAGEAKVQFVDDGVGFQRVITPLSLE